MQTIKVKRSKAKYKKHLVACILRYNRLGDIELYLGHEPDMDQPHHYISNSENIESLLADVTFKRGEGRRKEAIDNMCNGYWVEAWIPDYYIDAINDNMLYGGYPLRFV